MSQLTGEGGERGWGKNEKPRQEILRKNFI